MAVETRPQRFSLQRPALDGPTDLPGRAQWAVGIGAGRGGGPLAAGAQQRNTWTCSMPSGLKQAAPAARQAPPHPSSTSCRPGTKTLRSWTPGHSDGPSSPTSCLFCCLNFVRRLWRSWPSAIGSSSDLLARGNRLWEARRQRIRSSSRVTRSLIISPCLSASRSQRVAAALAALVTHGECRYGAAATELQVAEDLPRQQLPKNMVSAARANRVVLKATPCRPRLRPPPSRRP